MGRVRDERDADAHRVEADIAFASYPEIDDRFWAEWIEYGMIQLDAYLAIHARFARYCDKRDALGFRRLESAVLWVGRDSPD